MSVPGLDDAGVRFPPPLVFTGFVLLGPIVDQAAGLAPLPASGPVRFVIAMVLIVAGLGVGLTAVRQFGQAGTRPEPWMPSSTIVTGGIYRFTRNPMYVGMTLIAVGLGVAIASVGALIMVFPAAFAINRFVIAKEEAYLQRRFGADYEAYCRSVRRWF